MKNSKLLLFSLALIGGTWMFEACGSGQQKPAEDSVEAAKDANDTSNIIKVGEDDTKFAVHAADMGMTEVEASNTAKEKAVNSAVKELAATIVTHHTAANNELMMLAKEKNITLPMAVSEDYQKDITKLTQTKAADFDKDYINMMIDGHKKTIDLFEKESKDGMDAGLKTFANNTLPTLRSHLEAAQAIKDKMKW